MKRLLKVIVFIWFLSNFLYSLSIQEINISSLKKYPMKVKIENEKIKETPLKGEATVIFLPEILNEKVIIPFELYKDLKTEEETKKYIKETLSNIAYNNFKFFLILLILSFIFIALVLPSMFPKFSKQIGRKKLLYIELAIQSLILGLFISIFAFPFLFDKIYKVDKIKIDSFYNPPQNTKKIILIYNNKPIAELSTQDVLLDNNFSETYLISPDNLKAIFDSKTLFKTDIVKIIKSNRCVIFVKGHTKKERYVDVEDKNLNCSLLKRECDRNKCKTDMKLIEQLLPLREGKYNIIIIYK